MASEKTPKSQYKTILLKLSGEGRNLATPMIEGSSLSEHPLKSTGHADAL